MASVSFSGLATGLDTASIISQLVEIKRAPVYRLQRNRTGYENQIKSLSTFKDKLKALQDAANAMNTASEFSSLKASSSDTDFLNVTADDADFHRIPLAELEGFLRLFIRLDQPSPSIGFVDTTGVLVRRRHFHLPS